MSETMREKIARMIEPAAWASWDADETRREEEKTRPNNLLCLSLRTADEIIAALKEQQSGMEGFVLVPREPTEEMVRAGTRAYQNSAKSTAREAYSAMIAAAPTPDSDGEANGAGHD